MAEGAAAAGAGRDVSDVPTDSCRPRSASFVALSERELVISAREYLQAELPDLTTGDTPADIQRHIEGLKDGSRKEALSTLASRLVLYQHGLVLGGEQTAIDNPNEEAELLGASLTELRPHIQLWRTVTGVFSRE